MNTPTPEAFANFSPGFERSENPGTYHSSRDQTLKGFAAALTLSGLNLTFGFIPRVVAALQPWAEISERLRRNFDQISKSTSWCYAQPIKLRRASFLSTRRQCDSCRLEGLRSEEHTSELQSRG